MTRKRIGTPRGAARHEERARIPRVGITLAAAALVACGGGGGGGDEISVGFASTQSSVTEGASSSVLVRLSTEGGPLTEELLVTLADAGSGSALPGDDYPSIGSVVLAFPVGSAAGATVALDLGALDDSSFEGGSENLELELQSASSGAAIDGDASTHTVWIEDGDVASVAFATAGSSTPGEAGGDHQVMLVLDLDPGDTLGAQVRVEVSDLGTGTATSGADYGAFPDQSLTFPAGSVGGASSAVAMALLDDAQVEPTETVLLALAVLTQGAALGSPSQHLVSIVEDDAGLPTSMQVTGQQVSGGALVPLASGANLNLGTLALGAGPGAPLVLEIANAGSGVLSLSSIHVTGDSGDFRVETSPGPSSLTAAKLAGAPEPLPLYETRAATLPSAVEYTFDQAWARSLGARSTALLEGLVTPSGEALSLELERRAPPIAPDAVLRVDGALVPGGLRELVADLDLWVGRVAGEPDSSVFLSFSPRGARGWVRRGPELERSTLHIVPSARGERALLVGEEEVAARSSSGGVLGCTGAPLAPERVSAHQSAVGAAPLAGGLLPSKARLAIETDWQLFQKLGSETAVAEYVTQLIAAVSEVYVRDVQASLEIAYLGVYSQAGDPWAAQDSGGSPSALLNEFRASWVQSGWPVQADLAHFLSGAGLGGGIAYVGVLCSQGSGFGVSGSLHGQIDWGSFDGGPAPINWDFTVTAHELGHNFGASHTHSYCPPLDKCASNCTATTSCQSSTLMSYCQTCSGSGMNNIELRFHPFVAAIMRDEVASSCLQPGSLLPGGVLALEVSFDPTSSAGSKAATLTVSHDAGDEVSPFQLSLAGSATN